MAAPPSAHAFARLLRDEGLVVVEVGNWETHNRNHMGPWGPVNGVMIHHTVTSGTDRTVQLCRVGHSTLPGPLCHGVIAKDGRVHLIGYGRANHAGLGDPDVLAAVIAERALPADNEATTDGNRHFYGFECENLGDGKDPWPAAQLLAIEKVAAALCRYHGWGAGSVIGHLEWQPGKVDPRGFSMQTMRGRIAARLDGNQPIEEDGMQLSDQVVLGAWVKERWPDDKGLADGKIAVNTALGSGYAHARTASTLARVAANNSEKILAQLAAQGSVALTDAQLAVLADRVAAHPALAEQIAERVAAKLAERLAE